MQIYHQHLHLALLLQFYSFISFSCMINIVSLGLGKILPFLSTISSCDRSINISLIISFSALPLFNHLFQHCCYSSDYLVETCHDLCFLFRGCCRILSRLYLILRSVLNLVFLVIMAYALAIMLMVCAELFKKSGLLRILNLILLHSGSVMPCRNSLTFLFSGIVPPNCMKS